MHNKRLTPIHLLPVKAVHIMQYSGSYLHYVEAGKRMVRERNPCVRHCLAVGSGFRSNYVQRPRRPFLFNLSFLKVVDNFIFKITGENYALNYGSWTIVTACTQYAPDNSATCLESSNIFPGEYSCIVLSVQVKFSIPLACPSFCCASFFLIVGFLWQIPARHYQ